MTTLSDFEVLIVGAGPVGLTLAIDLGRRGIRCLLIEKETAPRALPKMERCNARSMEMYRRLGLADAIRSAGAPMTARMDVGVCRSMAEEPLVRFNYQSAAEAKEEISRCRDGTLPGEAAHLVSQYSLEPLLREVAEKTENVTVRMGCTLRSFHQDQDGVTAHIDQHTGESFSIRAAYLVGTDGGRSTVRKQLGIELVGDGGLAKKNQVFIHSENIWDVCPFPQGRMFFFTNKDQSVFSLQDSLKHFVFHTSCWGDEGELRKLIQETIGLPIKFDILAQTSWTLHLLLAERYADRRVFLAGDSVHLVVPTAGLGLNTGIADAIDLSWKLAATLRGWGGPQLLASYDIERRAIGKRNVEGSRYAALGQIAWRGAVRPSIYDDTIEGRGVRAAVTHLANFEQRKSHEQIGTEWGYRYEASPIVCSEDGDWVPDVREVYIPVSRPGARVPHIWINETTSVHDLAGSGYTLFKCGPNDIDTSAFEQAIRATGAPLAVIDLSTTHARDIYERNLLLLRPDLHVCWRGDVPPASADLVARIVTGHGPGLPDIGVPLTPSSPNTRGSANAWSGKW